MAGVDLSALNEAQRAIATTLDEPLFVEAGAGSGKTFTLTRRVVWALSEGSGIDGAPFLDDLSQVLVITFTNAAAREIKERVRSSLREAGMYEAALSVDDAWISTIHGMCQRILRRYALELGIDPSFGVCGTHQETELLDLAVERAVGAARREASPDSLTAAAFEEFEYPGVVTRTLSLVRCGRATIGGLDALTFPKGGGVARALEDLMHSYEALWSAKGLTEAAKRAVKPSLDALGAFCGLSPSARTASRAAVALESCKLPRPSKAIREILADAKAELAHAKALVQLEQASTFGPILLDLARRTNICYTELKRSQALLDNDDLVSLALEAIVNEPDIARCYANRFRLVMVDEFQDTDTKQLMLISALAGKEGAEEPRHLATVGDAQQSIYRFRGADVAVFNARGRRVPAAGHVRLDVNYRSHNDVLAFVDKVCGGKRGVLNDFMHLDAYSGRKDEYVARELPRIAVELTSNRGRGVTTHMRAQQLAQQLADRLASYRDAGQKPGGMALLLGSTTRAALYIDALRNRGIECVVTGGSTFTKAPEVGVMLSLLRTLANPRDTQTGLFPLLSSEMFELDANDFVQLGSRKQVKLDAPTKRTIDRGLMSLDLFGGKVPSQRLQQAHDVLVRAFESLGSRPVADVCLDVVRNSGWLSRLEKQGAVGVAKEANVLAAVRYIRDLTSEMGLGPVRAAAEFAHWMEVSKLPPASLAGAEQDTVRVMTIHASKGLEYPVVAVAECWNNPRHDSGLWSSTEEALTTVLIEPKGGVKLDGVDEATCSGDLVDIAKTMRDDTMAADAQEKARLLYVALTRAREALVLAVNVPVSNKGFSSDLVAGVVNALFDGELPPEGEGTVEYGGLSPASVCHVALDADSQVPEEQEPEVTERLVEIYPVEDVLCDNVVLARAREDVFSYSSALAGTSHDFGSSSSSKSKAAKQSMPRKEHREAMAQGESVAVDEDKATNLGSAFHTIAQAMIDCVGELEQERIDAICRRWSLSSRQRLRLDAALAIWRTSALREEALSWDVVRAEVPFFAQSGGSPHGCYVEGAIDLLCTKGLACEGPALVVDYKTGDLGASEEQVRARHAAQARLYAHVLLSMGFSSVECAFICVETGLVVRYS